MSTGTSQEKLKIRDRMKAIRQALSPEEVGLGMEAVARMVLSMPPVLDAGEVCVYASVGKEVPTDGIIKELLKTGKKVVVPDWEGWKQGYGLRVARINGPEDLIMENRVVPQPKMVRERSVPVEKVDVFLIPGLAFDSACNRLGMGGGYYDRLLSLSSPKATLIGLAYDFQVMSSLPADDHDIPVHQVVTPNRCVFRKGQHSRRRVTENVSG